MSWSEPDEYYFPAPDPLVTILGGERRLSRYRETDMQCQIQGYYRDDFESVTEGIDFGLFEEASCRNREAIQDIWDGGSPERTPVLLQPSNRNYAIRGGNGDKYLAYHDALLEQLASLRDAIREGYLTVPMVLCDFNTLPVSALFDPEIVAGQGETDAFTRPIFTERGGLEGLEKPTLCHSMMEVMLEETARLRRVLPDTIDVGVRLNTGPISVGAELRGATDLILDMKVAPDLYDHYMTIITDLYIEVRQAIHAAAGIELVHGKVRPDVSVHAPTTGVMICDDTVQILGPTEFEECASPYLEKVLAAFGGGTIHSCGDVSHLLTSLTQVRGLDAFEFGQGELVDWAEARTALKDLNLIFWPPARDQESLDTAFRILHEPKTFMYRGIELARAWDERW